MCILRSGALQIVILLPIAKFHSIYFIKSLFSDHLINVLAIITTSFYITAASIIARYISLQLILAKHIATNSLLPLQVHNYNLYSKT